MIHREILGLLAVCVLVACKPDPVAPAVPDVGADTVVAAPVIPPRVRFLHAAPELGTVQLRLDVDMVRAAKDAAPLPEIVPAFDAPPGPHTFSVERHADGKATPLAELAVALEGGRRYLLVLTAADDRGVLRLLDDDQQAQPADTEALVRVVHAAPGTDAIDVTLDPGWAFANVGHGRGTAYLARAGALVKLRGVKGLDAGATAVYERDDLKIEPGHRYIVVLTAKLVPAGDHAVAWIIDEPLAQAPDAP